MLPSSRTPEGQPLRCEICGKLSHLEPSLPLGDSVCPNCGCFALLPMRSDSLIAAKQQICNFVSEAKQLACRPASKREFGDFLVRGLVRSLAAHGAGIWRPGTKSWWFRVSEPILECSYECSDREAQSCLLAAKIMSTRRAQQEQGSLGAKHVLRLGVPLIAQQRIVGAITVVQRDGSAPNVQTGYLRFVSQIAAIAQRNPAFIS